MKLYFEMFQQKHFFRIILLRYEPDISPGWLPVRGRKSKTMSSFLSHCAHVQANKTKQFKA